VAASGLTASVLCSEFCYGLPILLASFFKLPPVVLYADSIMVDEFGIDEELWDPMLEFVQDNILALFSLDNRSERSYRCSDFYC